MRGPEPRHTATLLVSCPDRRGLVAALAQLLYGHGINILDADQHTDAEAGIFFQRIRVDLAEMHGDRHTLEGAIAETAERFGMRWRITYGDRRARVAILVSKTSHCMHDLLLRHRAGELSCDVVQVISNHPDLGDEVASYGVPFEVLPVTPETRTEQEAAIVQRLEDAAVDLVVLARYMQILSPDLCARYPERIINIHHSFLPAFIGQNPYRQAHERGVKLIGATAHYATPELDQGPIIEQDVARVSHRDTVRDLIRQGRDLEKLVLSRAVRHHLEDRILVYGNKTVVFT